MTEQIRAEVCESDPAGIMAVKRGRESGSDGGEVEYEKLRNERLRENQKRMEELGIMSLSKSLAQCVRSSGLAGDVASSVVARRRCRERLYQRGLPAAPLGKEKSVGRKAHLAGTGGYRPEIYTAEDEKLLGTAKNEWHLFVDGYVKGTRVYDPVLGKTCHQCRQKTLGRRTSCSICQSLHGQFCGDCLYMRYGENVVESNENENWECPVCRGICNCSFCRLKRGWTPTGPLYRKIKNLGYESVAHYLVLTRRAGIEVKAVDDKEADDKITVLKPEVAEPKTPTSAPSLLTPKKESQVQEKVPEIQSTLLSAGWRSRSGVHTRSKEEKLMNPNANETQPNGVDNEITSEVNSKEQMAQKRRGRPPKIQASGKAAFYGSVPTAGHEAKLEPVDDELTRRILVLDSDSEDSLDTPNRSTGSIAHRLRRRITN